MEGRRLPPCRRGHHEKQYLARASQRHADKRQPYIVPIMNLRIAFLGLGLMGTGMARRLQAAGFPLAVYNRNRAKAESFAGTGTRVATSPRDAAIDADI